MIYEYEPDLRINSFIIKSEKILDRMVTLKITNIENSKNIYIDFKGDWALFKIGQNSTNHF